MSNENIVTVNVEALTSLISTIVAKQLEQPLLYGNDHPIAQIVADEIDTSPRIKERLGHLMDEQFKTSDTFDRAVIDALDGSPRALRQAIEETVDYEEIAGNIDAGSIAHHVCVSDVASEIDLDRLVDHIDADEIAKALDYKRLAASIIDALRNR